MRVLGLLGLILLILAAIFFFVKIATTYLLIMVIIGVICIAVGSVDWTTWR